MSAHNFDEKDSTILIFRDKKSVYIYIYGEKRLFIYKMVSFEIVENGWSKDEYFAKLVN